MNKSDTSHRWFGSWRIVARPPLQDPADLGTAFGLDLSMSEEKNEPQPAPPLVKSGWMRRMTVRHRPAF
ncbi:MAG TPA: hypothetical protein VLM87_07610 [Rubrivivax sp.]|nr:hypothetical protein [Rubrivivax sp.]